MKRYLILLLVTISTLANAQRPVKRFIDNQTDSHVNILLNAGAENGTVGAVASVASDLAIDTNAGYGTRSFKWSPAGSLRNIAFSNSATPLSLRNKSCLAKIEYAGTNFATGEILMRVEDNGVAITDDLELSPTETDSLFRQAQIAFICPNTGTNLSIKLVNTVLGKTIYVDQLWLGNDYRLGIEPPKITAWKLDTRGALAWIAEGTISSEKVWYRRVGETMEVQGSTIFSTTGTGGELQWIIPDGLNISDNINVATFQAQGVVGVGGFLDIDGTTGVNQYSTLQAYRRSATTLGFATPLKNLFIGNEIGNGDVLNFNFSIPIEEWKGTGTTETVTLETQGWKADVLVTNASGSTITNGTVYTAVEDSDFSGLYGPTNNATVQQLCAGATAPVALGVSCGGNEVFGYRLNVPYSGEVEVCFGYGINFTAPDSMIYQINRVSTANTNTILQSGVGQQSVSPSQRIFRKQCESFQVSAGENDFALFTYKIGATANALVEITGASLNRYGVFTARMMTQNFPQAVALPVDKWQYKDITATGSITTSSTPFLQFNNLVPGKTYRYTAVVQMATSNVDTFGSVYIREGTTSVKQLRYQNAHSAGTYNNQSTLTSVHIFVATETSIQCFTSSISAAATIVADDGAGVPITWAILEELNHTSNTTEFN